MKSACVRLGGQEPKRTCGFSRVRAYRFSLRLHHCVSSLFLKECCLNFCIPKESIKTMNQPFNICLVLNFDILLICSNGIIRVAMRMLFKTTCLLLEMDVLLCFMTARPSSEVADYESPVKVFQPFPSSPSPALSAQSATSPPYPLLNTSGNYRSRALRSLRVAPGVEALKGHNEFCITW